MEECEKGQPDNHQPSQSSVLHRIWLSTAGQPPTLTIFCTAQDLAVDSQTTTNPHNLLYCTGSGCRQLDSRQSSQSAICTAQGPAVVAQWQSTSGSSQTPGDCQPLSLSSIFTWILTEMLVLFADNSTVDTNISVFHSSHEHQYLLLKPILWPP